MFEYDYVPLPKRAPLKWPGGAKVALMMTINLETWDLVKDTDKPYYAGGPALLPNPLAGRIPDYPNYSWREYGQRVGVWRMLDACRAAGVKASFATNAAIAERYPELIEAVLADGHEIIAHSTDMNGTITSELSEDEERALIADSLARIEAAWARKFKPATALEPA